MRLTPYEKNVQREVEAWQRGDANIFKQAFDWAMRPMDWVVERVVPAGVMQQADEAVNGFLSLLGDASEWSYDLGGVLREAQRRGIDAESLEDLRHAALEELDPLARARFTENALLAALEGGGTGLGGALLIAADIPLLFAINLRLIQQIGAAYGFPMRGPQYQPLVIAIFNVAASGNRDAKHSALREVSVAAAAFANDLDYRGRVSGTWRDQSRQVPREIAKSLVSRKIMQAVPVAGAAVGAGINYWFTTETAESAYMLLRALFVECKERM